MDKRTTERMAKLAGRVLETGKATSAEAKRLAASVLAQRTAPVIVTPKTLGAIVMTAVHDALAHGRRKTRR